MIDVMIKCPDSGEAVATYVQMPNAEIFEATQLDDFTLPECPECGKDHVWQKEDAFIAT
jgi:hypothetical protein